MTDDTLPVLKAEIQTEAVLPRTLGVRPLKYAQDGATEIELAGVYGGNAGNVWCATFFNRDEAQAWIVASNLFGQAVKGMVTTLPAIDLSAEIPNDPRIRH